jgi:hypothetical protein
MTHQELIDQLTTISVSCTALSARIYGANKILLVTAFPDGPFEPLIFSKSEETKHSGRSFLYGLANSIIPLSRLRARIVSAKGIILMKETRR